MTKGHFIAFEGGEGAGKTTQIKLLSKALRKAGHRVFITREPGGSEGGEDVRTLLKQGDKARWDGMSEALLLYAARHDHAEKVIKPLTEKGTWVLCDRFSDSSFAYQGFGRQVGLEKIEALHQIALGDFFPDLTFIFDIPSEESYKRVLGRQKRRNMSADRFDDMEMDFHNRVYKGYMTIAQKYAHRCATIHAHDSIENVHDAILKALAEKFTFTP